MGSSSVPLPSTLDKSATKPASAPAKFKIQPVPFNQYGSNLLDEKLLAADDILQPEPISMTIILDEDSTPDSDSLGPEILKRSKLSVADREEVGWESPKDWEYDNETLAQKIAKLKKKQDGEVENPPASKLISSKEAAGTPGVSNVKKPGATTSTILGARTSSRFQGAQGESILKKATKRTAARAGVFDIPSPPPNASFLAFPEFLDSHFLGVAQDCGPILDAETFHAKPSSPALSLIRAKEQVQAKLAEAIEKAYLLRQAAEERDRVETQPSATSTRVVPSVPLCPEAACQGDEGGNAESIMVASLIKPKRKINVTRPSPAPRTNLRVTPARQARAAALNLQ
jgi:hypothetical protein